MLMKNMYKFLLTYSIISLYYSVLCIANYNIFKSTKKMQDIPKFK